MTCANAQVYENTSSLRYGHLMIMTDQDHDGSHIKGLIMNFLHSFFPSLLRIPGFLLEFITPIVKVCAGEPFLTHVRPPTLCACNACTGRPHCCRHENKSFIPHGNGDCAVRSPQARRGREVKAFYTIPEYEAWKESLDHNLRGWDIKYYKGLGTSTQEEAREYFSRLDQHRKEFVWAGKAGLGPC